MTTVAAVDFGATSIRVARVDLDARPPAVEVVHRHPHQPVAHPDGSLRWDWDRLVAETERGLERALAAGPVASIGIDTWGVDYGLVDGDGRLLSPPHSYRSARTEGFRDVVERVGERRLYELAGLQLQPFNTIFQLAVHDRAEIDRAAGALLLPDLLVHHLTGARGSERTAAGTTGLLDVRSGDWSEELLAATGVPAGLFGAVVEPGTAAGTWRGVPVHRVGGHDTASAVLATPPGTGAFVASGTWLLVGRPQPEPDTGEDARHDNFTNEQGVAGDIRFLKNLAGFWLLEGCRSRWGGVALADVLSEAAAVDGGYAAFDVTDPRFLAPEDMEAEVRDAAGLGPEAAPPVVARAIVESMAEGTAAVLDRIGAEGEVALIGGGAAVPLLHDALVRRTGRPVVAGPVEAAVIGNALVQGVALGRFPSLEEARATLSG